MRGALQYLAWFSLLAALAACGAAYYFASAVGSLESTYASTRIDVAQQAVLAAAHERTSALVRDTSLQRVALERYLQPSALAAAQLIAEAGASAGVSPQISDVMPENAPARQPSSGSNLNAVGFVVQAQGSFAALTRMERLLENLPIAASVERFDISRTPSGGSTSWHMSVYVRLLTTSALSS